jgi:hypothetical protein
MCSHEDDSLWFGCVKGRSIKYSLHISPYPSTPRRTAPPHQRDEGEAGQVSLEA